MPPRCYLAPLSCASFEEVTEFHGFVNLTVPIWLVRHDSLCRRDSPVRNHTPVVWLLLRSKVSCGRDSLQATARAQRERELWRIFDRVPFESCVAARKC